MKCKCVYLSKVCVDCAGDMWSPNHCMEQSRSEEGWLCLIVEANEPKLWLKGVNPYDWDQPYGVKDWIKGSWSIQWSGFRDPWDLERDCIRPSKVHWEGSLMRCGVNTRKGHYPP